MKKPQRPESAMAEPMRKLVEHAIADGAVTALLVWETADGRIGVWSEPNLLSVKRGLADLAFLEPKSDEE